MGINRLKRRLRLRLKIFNIDSRGKIWRHSSLLQFKEPKPQTYRGRKSSCYQRAMLSSCSIGICSYCGCKLTKANFSVDHVVPCIKGGTSSYFNLTECCITCNEQKGSQDLLSFMGVL